MINNRIIKNISANNIYLFENNFFIEVYFNSASSNFIKAKFVKVCFLPLTLKGKRPIHLNSDVDKNKKSYDNTFFNNARKNVVQSKFYSKNIITANLQDVFPLNLIEKSNAVFSDTIKNILKIKRTDVSRLISNQDLGFKIHIYVLDKNKKILDTYTIQNENKNIFNDYKLNKDDLINNLIEDYSSNVNIILENFTVQNNRVMYGESGPSLYVPGYSNTTNNDNILLDNNLEIRLNKGSANISMLTEEIFEINNERFNNRVQDYNVLLRRKILSNYDSNIIKNLYNSFLDNNLESSSLFMSIKTDAGCYEKEISVSKNQAYSFYNSFLIRHRDRHTFENFREKYVEDYVDVDGGMQEEGVLKHNFISLDTEFLKSVVMNQTKFVTIEFRRSDLNNKLCFYLDDTLNPQNKITPYSIESSSKAVYLIETLYSDSIYYTKFRNGIKSIFCNDVQVYPETVQQDFDEENTTTVDNDHLNASNTIIDSIISNDIDINDEIFLDRSLIEKSSELLERLKYETDDSGVLMSDLLNNTLVKLNILTSNSPTIENVLYDKLSNKISSINDNVYGIKITATESKKISASISFIVFEKGTLSSLYSDNPDDSTKESYCKTLNNIAPKRFTKIDKSIQELSIRNDKDNYLEFEKIFSTIDSYKSLRKKHVSKVNIKNSFNISAKQLNTNLDGEIISQKRDINTISKETIIKNYGQNVIDKKFYINNALLEYINKSLCITRMIKSKSNIVSIDLSLLEKELGFVINKKDLQIYYHVNLGFDKNKKLNENENVKQNSYLVDKQYFNFTQLFNFNIAEEKLIINIDEKTFKFDKLFFEKANKLFGVDGKLILKNVLQRFLIIFENQEREEYFVIEESIVPDTMFKDNFKVKNKNNLNIDVNQKNIKHPNIKIKMV